MNRNSMTEPTAHSSSNRPNGNIPQLTGLRFIAAAYVFFYHFGAHFFGRFLPPSLTHLFSNGYMGVSFFFILSGFILGITYSSGITSMRQYALSRFSRIYPIYLLALLIAFPLPFVNINIADLIRVLTLTQAWHGFPSEYGFIWIGPAWSLSVEAFFYAAFPALNFLYRRASNSALYAIVTAVSLVIIFLGLPYISPGSVRPDLGPSLAAIPIPFLRLPEFIFGCLCAEIFISRPTIPRHKLKYLAPLGLFVPLLLALDPRSHLYPQAMGLSAVVIGLFIVGFSFDSSGFSRVLSHPFFVHAGKMSFSIYLLQGPCRDWIREVAPDSLAGRVLNPVVLILCSMAAYKYIESPMRNMLLRLRGSKQP